jgi:hypothetical protein
VIVGLAVWKGPTMPCRYGYMRLEPDSWRVTDPLEDPPAAVVALDDPAVVADDEPAVVALDELLFEEPQAARARAPATRTIGTVRFKGGPPRGGMRPGCGRVLPPTVRSAVSFDKFDAREAR